ncbi:hypothetical protein LTR53_005972 [Teratosphaeriaceae sp. CCFEE 6253]|nr:hypothetical protein LTR53_005972 [Teratosphaeriaceae sp. CCFEE 6253]
MLHSALNPLAVHQHFLATSDSATPTSTAKTSLAAVKQYNKDACAHSTFPTQLGVLIRDEARITTNLLVNPREIDDQTVVEADKVNSNETAGLWRYCGVIDAAMSLSWKANGYTTKPLFPYSVVPRRSHPGTSP